jgi:hypothetical protein
MFGVDRVPYDGSEKIAAFPWFMVAVLLAICFAPGWIAWFSASGTRNEERERRRLHPLEDEAYLQWFMRRQNDRETLGNELIQIENLFPKAYAQFVANLPSVLGGVEYFLELAERQLPLGSPQFFWDTISKLDVMLFQGIPDKVWAIQRRAGAGRVADQVEALEQEVARYAKRLQGLVARAKGLEAFAQEHSLRCAYEKRELEDFRRRFIRPKRSTSLGAFTDWDDGGHGGHGGGGDDGGGH